jgi:hypothetical protein
MSAEPYSKVVPADEAPSRPHEVERTQVSVAATRSTTSPGLTGKALVLIGKLPPTLLASSCCRCGSGRSGGYASQIAT